METHARQAAQELMEFIAAAPSPFHAVARAAEKLSRAGFQKLREADVWTLEPHGRYFVTRNGSALAAFIAGGGPVEEHGLRIIGTHTDSPTFRLKPLPVLERHGYIQLGLEAYGGPIAATWLDRDLGIAGRVFLSAPGEKPGPKARTARGAAGRQAGGGRTPQETMDAGLEARLLLVDRPVARIAHLAIHLDRESADKGLLLNRENHLPPILGLSGTGAWDFHGWLGAELGVAPERILDHDLCLFDLTPPALAGIAEEFLVSSRLDNLSSTFAALRALLLGAKQEIAAGRIIVLCDSEEIGSSTRQGASGTFLGDVIERVAAASPSARRRGRGASAGGFDPQALHRVRARSHFVSADLAHAIHPNYPDKHEARHAPKLNGGPVIKYSASQRYATDAESGAFFLKVCREAEVPAQKYVVRADMTAGSTIGPLVAARLGLKAVDIGSAVLSMHSCRETGGSLDPHYMVRAMARYLVR
jgi:aspartyl aminopeptidase